MTRRATLTEDGRPLRGARRQAMQYTQFWSDDCHCVVCRSPLGEVPIGYLTTHVRPKPRKRN